MRFKATTHYLKLVKVVGIYDDLADKWTSRRELIKRVAVYHCLKQRYKEDNEQGAQLDR